MKKQMTSLKADIVLFIVALLWGTTFVMSKFSLEQIPPLTIISMRFILAVVLMTFLFYKEVKTITISDLKGGIIVGVVLFLAFALQLTALKYTEPGKQAFLAATYVIFVPFIVWFITKKSPDHRSFFGAFTCFVGIALLTLKGGFYISFGDTLTLISSIFFGLHIITTERYVKKSTPVKIAIIQFTTVAILSTASALIFETFPTGVKPSVWLGILYLGILCTGIAYYLQTFAQTYTKSTHTAIILSLEAVFGSILSVIFMKEIFTFRMIIGCLIIFVSILVIELKGNTEAIDKAA